MSAPGASSSTGQLPFEENLHPSVPNPTGGRSGKKSLSVFLPWLLAAAFAAALGALALRARAPEAAVVRAKIPPPEGTTFWLEANGPGPAVIAPDGKQIAFTAVDAAGKVNLYVRALDALEARVLSGAEGAQYPFWSHDSRSLGFFTQGKLKTIDVAGGSPLVICNAAEGKGASWSRKGVILFASSPNGPLWRVSDRGGEPVQVTKLDPARGDNSHRHPRFLPDGDRFLYVARSAASVGEGFPIVLASLDGGAEKVLLRSPAAPQFASGHLLYLRDATLMARPMAADGTFRGDALPLADRIMSPSLQTAVAVFSASENGILVTQSARGELSARLQWYTRDGKPDGAVGDPGEYLGVVLSPDGRLAAATIVDPATSTFDLWIVDVARGVRTRFTFDPGNDRLPVWSPDGRSIVFSSNRKGHEDLYRKSLEGSGEEEPILVSNVDKEPCAWTPDGRAIVFTQPTKDGGMEIRTLSLEGAKSQEGFLSTRKNIVASPLSPDGKWLPYSSDESGRWEVYATSFPKAGRKWQISTEGGAYAFWGADGKEIIYHDMNGIVRAVAVQVRGETLEIGASRPIMRSPGPSPTAPSFSPAADHQRLLAVGAGQTANTLLDLVVNWPLVKGLR